MRLTLSVIKADVGSVGGHTKPSARLMATVEGEVAKAIDNGLLIDGFVCHTGDDIAITMTHTRGEGSSEVHQFAWKTFTVERALPSRFCSGADIRFPAAPHRWAAGPHIRCRVRSAALPSR